MRYLLLVLVLLMAGCQSGFNANHQPPSYEWRYDPYTGQRIR